MAPLADIRRNALRSLIPPPRVPLSEWIEHNIKLPEGVSALPGRVRLWPYQREIADAISDPAIERDFNQWYEQEHLSERMAIPGFLRARRFTAIEGAPKYLALYDLETSEVLNSAAYRHVVGAGKSAWTRRMEPQFRNFTRNVYVSISDRQR